MKTNSKNRFTAMLLIGALAVMVPQLAMAVTPACQDIANTASVAYKVGTIDQTPATGSVTFKVGNKVNLTVATTDVANVSIVPGSTNQVLTFTVTNNGNATQDYSLTAIPNTDGTAAFSGIDTFNIGDLAGETMAVYVETAGGAGYQAASDTATYIDELTAGSSKTVYIVFNGVNSTQANGEIAVYDLKATSRVGGAAADEGAVEAEGAANACGGTAPTVFADTTGTDATDTARDGEHSVESAYQVVTANIAVSKTSTVYYDPVNCSSINPLTCTGTPRMIPGARYTYSITVNNTGGATASNVKITDSLNAEIVATRLAFLTQYDEDATGGTTCAAGEGIYVNGACETNTNGDGDGTDWTANTVTVDGLSIAAAGTATVKFQVEIQ